MGKNKTSYLKAKEGGGWVFYATVSLRLMYLLVLSLGGCNWSELLLNELEVIVSVPPTLQCQNLKCKEYYKPFVLTSMLVFI